MRLRVGSFPLPFRSRFAHAAAARERAENVVVLATDDSGHVGLGEGCPRAYVTGETVPSALGAIARWRTELEGVGDRADLERWLEWRTDDVDRHPSAFAAVELALLDVLARRAGLGLEGFLDVAAPRAPLRTSAVYGDAATAKFLTQVARFNLYGMRDAKLKLSGDAGRDTRRAWLLARCGPVRVDANNLWPDAAAARHALDGLRRHVWAVEEPLTARDFAGLAELGRSTGLAVVLDESATRLTDLEALVPGPAYVLNARVSKHGGLLRTLALIRAARARGLRIVVGAQVGETSILARAGVVAARAAGDALVGFEGAFGLRLLTRDATTVSLGFGYGGRVALENLEAMGSGLSATDEVLAGCE